MDMIFLKSAEKLDALAFNESHYIEFAYKFLSSLPMLGAKN